MSSSVNHPIHVPSAAGNPFDGERFPAVLTNEILSFLEIKDSANFLNSSKKTKLLERSFSQKCAVDYELPRDMKVESVKNVLDFFKKIFAFSVIECFNVPLREGSEFSLARIWLIGKIFNSRTLPTLESMGADENVKKCIGELKNSKLCQSLLEMKGVHNHTLSLYKRAICYLFSSSEKCGSNYVTHASNLQSLDLVRFFLQKESPSHSSLKRSL